MMVYLPKPAPGSNRPRLIWLSHPDATEPAITVSQYSASSSKGRAVCPSCLARLAYDGKWLGAVAHFPKSSSSSERVIQCNMHRPTICKLTLRDCGANGRL